jgi:hypothetical protein
VSLTPGAWKARAFLLGTAGLALTLAIMVSAESDSQRADDLLWFLTGTVAGLVLGVSMGLGLRVTRKTRRDYLGSFSRIRHVMVLPIAGLALLVRLGPAGLQVGTLGAAAAACIALVPFAAEWFKPGSTAR